MSFLFSLRSFRASHKADVLAVNSDSFSSGLILLDVEFLVDSVVVFPPSVSPAACWPPLFLTRGQLGAAQVPSLVHLEWSLSLLSQFSVCILQLTLMCGGIFPALWRTVFHQIWVVSSRHSVFFCPFPLMRAAIIHMMDGLPWVSEALSVFSPSLSVLQMG